MTMRLTHIEKRLERLLAGRSKRSRLRARFRRPGKNSLRKRKANRI